MLVASPAAASYRCPGEFYDITRAVHLARLAAGYERCATCTHRIEPAEAEASRPRAEGDRAPSPAFRRSLFTAEGVRGVYQNELTRQRAGEIAGAFASCLWDDQAAHDAAAPRISSATAAGEGLERDTPGTQGEGEGLCLLPAGEPGPLVILAGDDRPASPDLAMGVGLGLRRMGCRVIDIGPVTRPCFWFAVDHLQAAGGIQVTGAGCDPAWTGLDFVRPGALPCVRGDALDRIRSRFEQRYERPSRHVGAQRLHSVTAAYEATLGQHVHGLRPFELVLACPHRILRDVLERLLARSACRPTWVDVPTRARALANPHDPDLLRVAERVRDRKAHLGILIDDDAQGCRFFDDNGRAAEPAGVLRLLATPLRTSGPSPSTVESVDEHWRLDEAGRFWLGGVPPSCDAVLTLLQVLQSLSRQDTPLSELLAAQSRRAPAAP